MWRCSNCGTGVEDKYAHCWQCGKPNVVKQRTQAVAIERAESKSTPGFASYEELAHVPSRPMWFLRRGPLQRGFWFLLAIIIFKVAASPFLGKYGVYIVAGVAVIALILILWGFFRRDPNEGVGIKLN
jgi:DNA-directed RNA polymerase subunit RPC12/RpoP